MAYENLTRLPDPTTAPAGPGFLSVALTDNSTGLVHPLNTGGTVSVQYAGNYWSISISYPELTLEEAAPFIPVLDSLSGGFRNFYIQLPMHINPRTGVWDTSTAVKIAQGAITIGTTDREIVIPAWNLRGGNLSPGDMLKFTNSNKIYRISSASLVDNTMTLQLNCPILEPAKIPSAGLEPNNIMFRVRMLGDPINMEFTSRGLYNSFSISLRENIK